MGRPDRRPQQLPLGVWGWMPRVWRTPQADVVRLAGMDAAMHLRVLTFGALCLPQPCLLGCCRGSGELWCCHLSSASCALALCSQQAQLPQSFVTRESTVAAPFLCAHAGAELFFALTFWCCIIVLPVNLTVR